MYDAATIYRHNDVIDLLCERSTMLASQPVPPRVLFAASRAD